MDDKATLLRTAKDDLVQGRVAQAQARYEAMLAADAADVDAMLGLGRACLASGDNARARELALGAAALRPSDPEAPVLAAVALEAAGQREQALTELQATTAANPGSCLANYHTGRLLAASGQGEAALVFLERATQFEGQNHPRHHYEIHSLRGNVLQALGRFELAAEAHRKALLMAPTRLDAYLGLAEALLGAADFAGAHSVLCQAESALGERVELFQKKAELYARAGKPKLALECAQRVCERQPSNARAWLNVAGLRMVNHDLQAAEWAANRARDLEPDAWQPHFQLGLIHDAAGRQAKAEAAYRDAVRRKPSSWEPANNLGLVILAKDGAEAAAEAERFFRQALDLVPAQELGPKVNLALALGKQNKRAECLELCTELLAHKLPERVSKRLQAVKREAESA